MNLTSVDELLIKAKSEELFSALIQQLNKDFSGVIDLAIPLNITPIELKGVLCNNIVYLLLKDTTGYQNVLYRIDVSEQKIKSVNATKTNEYVESVVFLILKREWQKVWFRNKL